MVSPMMKSRITFLQGKFNTLKMIYVLSRTIVNNTSCFPFLNVILIVILCTLNDMYQSLVCNRVKFYSYHLPVGKNGIIPL